MMFFALYLAGRRTVSTEPLNGESALLIPIGLALANFIVIKSVFAQTDNHPIIFMILGMLAALLYRFSGKHKHS
jgi:hypothetical protein